MVSGETWMQNAVSRDNHLCNYLCKRAHYSKGLIDVSQEFFASINKIFILSLGYYSIEFSHSPNIF